jgi:hypothetical protein
VPGCTETTIAASVTANGSAANGIAASPTITAPWLLAHALSGTGRYIIFEKDAPNLIPAGTPIKSGESVAPGVFIRDTCIGVGGSCTPTTIVVSLDSAGEFINGYAPSISIDGHYCAFSASGEDVGAQGVGTALQQVRVPTGF